MNLVEAIGMYTVGIIAGVCVIAMSVLRLFGAVR